LQSGELPTYLECMRFVVVLVIVSLAACSVGVVPLPDAMLEYGPHDQVTACDPQWSSDGVAPAVCDRACAVRPIELPCADLARPCAHTDLPCSRANSPSGPPIACPATFDVARVRGCCAARLVGSAMVPTFYECQW
jgi:hypothetical protein